MRTRHAFSALVLLAAGVLISGCAPVTATETPISVEPTEVVTTEPTEAMTAEPTIEATAEATEAEPEALFAPVSSQPILNAGTQFMDPGAVAYHEGVYHIFANQFDGWPARVDIVHGTSTDGVNWEYASLEPILSEKDVPYAKLAILATSALVDESGTWMLYFYTWDDTSRFTPGVIGRATATDPNGPWTVDPNPALEPGPDGAWDELRVGSASVIQTDDGYVMYYATNQLNAGRGGIGLATSEDGATWAKYDDSATTDDAYAESDPIFMPAEEGAWDDAELWQPNVVATDQGYVMLYKGGGGGSGSGDLGLAFSEDGMEWQRLGDEPIFKPNIITGGQNIWFTNLMLVDDTLHAFLEVGKGGRTRVYLVTHQGVLGQASGTPSATDDQPLFTVVGDAPIIRHGDDWDASFAYPVSIVEQDGTFYLFRTSTTGRMERTGYHTSADLLTWTASADNPILSSDMLDDPGDMLLPWSIVQAEDGAWVMYLWSWKRSDSGDAWIGRATAESPEGPWTLDERRLLEPSADDWDRIYIQTPSVVMRPEGGFAMLYEGSQGSQNLAEQGFGWATSEDGIEWERHGPAVMRRGERGEWDSRFIQQPHIVHTPDGYVMVYDASATTDPGGYGIAYSVDGITWTRHPANPIFTAEDFPQAAYPHVSSLFWHDGTYYLLLELATPDGQASDIWLATHEGSILP